MEDLRKQWWWLAWPGLRHVWLHHSYPALALAVGSTLLLNLLLAAELVWTEWLSSAARSVGWGVVLGVWSVAAGVTWWTMVRERRLAASSGDSAECDPLAAATEEYLQGKWYEAERLLRQQLRRNKKDVEAHLMLATLCRHTGRLDESERRLDELEALEAAAKWQVEIAAERKMIQRRRIGRQENPGEHDNATDPNNVPQSTTDMTRAA